MRILHSKINLLVVITLIVSAILLTGVIFQTGTAYRLIAEQQAVSESNLLRLTYDVHARQHDKLLQTIASPKGSRSGELSTSKMAERVLHLFENYPISFIVICDSSLLPEFSFPKITDDVQKALPDNAAAFNNFRNEEAVARYYSWINDTLVRISVIDITTKRDGTEHSDKEILFVGVPELPADLAGLTQGHATLLREPTSYPIKKTVDEGKVLTQFPLLNWKNTAEAALSLETNSEVLQLLSIYRMNFIWFLVISVLLFILFITIYLIRYFKWPLRMFTLSIKNNDPSFLQMVRTVDHDFSTLQHTVMNIFSHERLLNEMIRRKSTDTQNAFYAAILSHIGDAIYATNHKGIITYWNHGAEKIYNVEEQEALGKVAEELIKSQWNDPVEADKQKRLFKSNGFMRGILDQEKPDGSKISVDAGISILLDCNGEPLGQLYISREAELVNA